MRALSLCQSCKRHIRVTESACPFCGAAFTPTQEPQGLRPRGRPGGRAALFLAGAAAAPGCVEEPDLDEQLVPVYGAPVDPDASRVQDGGTASDASGDAREPMAVPVYGVAVYGVPPDRDGGRDANACGEQGAPLPMPVYGIAIDGGAARDAGRGAGSCGLDAGPARDAEIGPVPPYGIGIDPGNRRDASARDGEVLVTPVYGLAAEIAPEDE